MTIENAVEICRATGLTGWELVEFAQSLVHQNMEYSITNSLDSPQQAFERGQGYCYHQASTLNMVLLDLGFHSRLVHAFRNLFPKAEFSGAVVRDFVSGHVWCRVTIDGVEKDVCPGSANNKPGVVHFKPLSKVLEWNKRIEFATYYGAALVNAHRKNKYEKVKKRQQYRWNPEHCPCRKTSCERYKKCDECKEHHYFEGSLPYCER